MKHKITTFILLLASILVFNNKANAQNWDIRTLETIHSNPNPLFKGYSTFISESSTAIAIAVPLALSIASLANRNDDMLKNAISIGTSQLVDGVLKTGLKALINRSRPYVTYPELIEPYRIMTTSSMPSGHTSLAFVTATSLSLKYPKWYVVAPSYFWAFSVGYSRINLGVHYPTDVIAGAFLGAGSALLTQWVNNWFWEKKDHKRILPPKNYPL